MAPPDRTYWILLACSEVVLIIFAIIAIQQLCITNTFNDKPRLRRISLILLNILCFLILNVLVYLSAIWPHQILFGSTLNIHSLYIIMEGITAIIVFHTYRQLFIFILNVLYSWTSSRAPKSFTYFVNIMEIIFIISIILCHGGAIFFDDEIYIYYFYIILGAIILILDIVIMCLFRKPLKLLNALQKPLKKYKKSMTGSRIGSISRTGSGSKIGSGSRYSRINGSISASNSRLNARSISRSGFDDVLSGKRKINGALFVAILICIAALIDITFTIEKILGSGWSFDFLLISNIMHSFIVNILCLALILWIYQPEYCCIIPDNSVCDIWCCQWFCCEPDIDTLSNMIKKRERQKKEENDVLLQNSHGSVQNGQATITDLKDDRVEDNVEDNYLNEDTVTLNLNDIDDVSTLPPSEVLDIRDLGKLN